MSGTDKVTAGASLRDAEVQRLRAALEEWEEREASVCGEDFSFEETIHFLRTKLESLETGLVIPQHVDDALRLLMLDARDQGSDLAMSRLTTIATWFDSRAAVGTEPGSLKEALESVRAVFPREAAEAFWADKEAERTAATSATENHSPASLLCIECNKPSGRYRFCSKHFKAVKL